MSQTSITADQQDSDVAPGVAATTGRDAMHGVLGYSIGFVLATALTVVSFCVPSVSLVWAPSLPVALCVLAVAQMGIHLVFFLHIGTGPDSTNNVMALAFGILIVFLVISGSLWIMSHLNHNMMPMDRVMQMQR